MNPIPDDILKKAVLRAKLDKIEKRRAKLPYILLVIFWGVFLLLPEIGIFLTVIGFIFIAAVIFFIYACINLKNES